MTITYKNATLDPIEGRAEMVGVLRLMSGRPLRLVNGDTLALSDRSSVIGADTRLASLTPADIS